MENQFNERRGYVCEQKNVSVFGIGLDWIAIDIGRGKRIEKCR